MEQEKMRVRSNTKQSLRRYLFPITMVSSILISGSVGYAASQLAVNNSGSDSSEMKTMKNQVTETRTESIKVVETEIPKIIRQLEKYNQDIDLIDENIKLLEGNLAPIRDTTGYIDKTVSVVKGASAFIPGPIGSKININLAFTQIKLDEIDSILLRMENLTVIQQEMDDSQEKIISLYEEYKKEKSIEQLILIEEELNSNLIYQIEDLRNITMEAQEVFELSSSILTSINTVSSLFNLAQEKSGAALDVIQFWKDNKDETKIEPDVKEDLEASKKEIQNLPKDLAQQSKNSITSINKIQNELQTLRITQMVIGE